VAASLKTKLGLPYAGCGSRFGDPWAQNGRQSQNKGMYYIPLSKNCTIYDKIAKITADPYKP
jgi:hypothetical protein